MHLKSFLCAIAGFEFNPDKFEIIKLNEKGQALLPVPMIIKIVKFILKENH